MSENLEIDNKQQKGKKKNRAGKKSRIVSSIIIVVCIIVFCVSAFELYDIFSEYKFASDEYSGLASLIPRFEADTEGEVEESLSGENLSEADAEEVIIPAPVFMEGVDWKSLYDVMYDINNDYQAWIYISDTKINYPIVQGTDNEYYLNHTFYKEEVFSASLFIDYRIENGAEGKNVIVYGHNMRDGSMFAGLKKFRQEDFRKRHPSFSVYTSTGAYEYKIFATYTTSPDSATYTTSFANDEEFVNYVDMVKGWSDVDYGVEVSAEDQIITLSTCVNNNQDRYVVHAKRIK